MKTQRITTVTACGIMLGLALFANAANGQTDFTWQGWLVDGTTFLDGQYDLRLRLFDTPEGGSKLGNDVFRQDVTVSNGNFGGTLDFGVDIFDGQVRYVEIAFRLATLNDPYPYKVLNAPRQEVLRTHHTILAETIGIGTSTPDADLVVQNSKEGYPGISQVKVMYGPSRFALRAAAGMTGCALSANVATDSQGKACLDDQSLPGWDLYMCPVDDYFQILRFPPQTCPIARRDGLLTINGQGNVGIGTTRPACKLDVRGGAQIALIRADDCNNFGIADFDGHQALGVYGNGRVGIGTMIPAHRLDVSGNIGCVLLYQTSDERFKTNVTELTSALDKIEKIRGVSFEWNEKAESVGAEIGQRQIGVVAQEVESVFPELVASSAAGYKSVDYTKLTAVLIEAVKELKAESRALKAESRALKADNETLRRRLEVLETALD